ncbi:MAG: hypothetical protein HYX92_16895 [Chloroflexi bacterium]|nr:hypothetical protein [Chloroflexota bacterium]
MPAPTSQPGTGPAATPVPPAPGGEPAPTPTPMAPVPGLEAPPTPAPPPSGPAPTATPATPKGPPVPTTVPPTAVTPGLGTPEPFVESPAGGPQQLPKAGDQASMLILLLAGWAIMTGGLVVCSWGRLN